MTLEARFWAKVDRVGPDDCWLWQAARNSDGYGVIRVEGRLSLAHRVSLVLAGRDPGRVARHSCDTPACVNPGHLTGGTQAENVRDGVVRGRLNRGVANAQALLSDADVREIRSLAATLSRAELAVRFGVSKEAVRDVLIGRTWAHVEAAA